MIKLSKVHKFLYGKEDGFDRWRVEGGAKLVDHRYGHQYRGDLLEPSAHVCQQLSYSILLNNHVRVPIDAGHAICS